MKVDIDYLTVWNAMNDLEELSSKLVSIRSIIEASSDAASNDDVDQAGYLSTAAREFLDWYIQSWDEKFAVAWNETVSAIKRAEWDAIKGNDSTLVYTEEELNAMCDKAEQDQKQSPYEQMKSDGWENDGEGGWFKISDC